MKKIILSVTMLAIAASTVFTSCKKESHTNSGFASTTTIQQDLFKIGEKYKSNNAHLLKATEGERRLAAAGADLTAALVVLGETWALNVIPGLGFVTGAAAGVAAAGASVAAYHALGMVANPNGGFPNDPIVISNIANHSGFYNVPNPHNNPYENIGIRHNELLKVYYSGAMTHPVSNVTSVFDSTQLNSNELQAVPLISNALPVAMNNFLIANPIEFSKWYYAVS